MNTYDSIMIPILITDADGIILYKNRAAKRCIPSPRRHGNINNYLNIKMKAFRCKKEGHRIEFIKNNESAFNRALVFKLNDSEEIWCFIPELLMSEPEDLRIFTDMIDTRSLTDFFTEISDADNGNDKNLFIRYQRVYTRLLSEMKLLNTEYKGTYFAISDILASLKKKTVDLASLYGLRISLDIGITDVLGPYSISFRGFASMYTQLITLALCLTDTTGCAISFFPLKEGLMLTVSSALPETELPTLITPETLYNLYPKHAANILLLESTAKFYDFTLDTSIIDDRLILSLFVPLEDRDIGTLHQNIPEIIRQGRFERLEKRFGEYMEAMFLQI